MRAFTLVLAFVTSSLCFATPTPKPIATPVPGNPVALQYQIAALTALHNYVVYERTNLQAQQAQQDANYAKHLAALQAQLSAATGASGANH